jgi:hypothetical protein
VSEFTDAKRVALPLLLGFAGGTGSGKTYSAMRAARGISGAAPFYVIDTENGRALHYADEFRFKHMELRAPFRPAAYADAIAKAEQAGAKVIVVDSMSHEWAGDGGMLDWHDELEGGDPKKKMTAWIEPKKEHRRFVTRLLQVKAHVILCFRAEPKVDVVTRRGKIEIVPKQTLPGGSLDGWIPISEKALPFELTASFLLMADAPGVPKPIKLPEKLRAFVSLQDPVDEETGARLASWASGAGPSLSPSEPQVAAKSSGGSDPEDGPATITREQGEALKRLAKEHDAPLTDLLRGYGVERMGQLTVAQYDELTAFIAGDKQEVLA